MFLSIAILQGSKSVAGGGTGLGPPQKNSLVGAKVVDLHAIPDAIVVSVLVLRVGLVPVDLQSIRQAVLVAVCIVGRVGEERKQKQRTEKGGRNHSAKMVGKCWNFEG